MTDKPDGYIGGNTFVRTAQALTPTLFLCETQQGTKGKGKVWRQSIVGPNPNFDATSPIDAYRRPWAECAFVRIDYSKYVPAGQHKAVMWTYAKGETRRVEAVFPSEEEAVRFMIFVAPEFFK